MLKIADGRKHFWQWDLNQKFLVEYENVCHVHFEDPDGDVALTVETYDLDGKKVADVPNILLQKPQTIHAYVYRCEGDECTIKHTYFNVYERQRPADYVYTETEVQRWETLEERIAALEQGGSDGAGGSGGVSSWNDLTDKPFGETQLEVELIPEGGLTNVDGQWAASPAPIMPIDGQTYTVTYNGIAYTTTAYTPEMLGGNILVLGNAGAAGLPGFEDTGEPFICTFRVGDYAEPSEMMFMPMDGASEVDVSIKGVHTVIEKLDGRFHDSVVRFYIDDLVSSGMRYMYKDRSCESVISLDELKRASGKVIELVYAETEDDERYYAYCVDVSSDQGAVYILKKPSNGSLAAEVYYTAKE